MANANIGEVAAAYLIIAQDYEFKLRNKINKLWLYTCDSVTDL